MTAPLSDEDERAVQLMVGRIVGKSAAGREALRLAEEVMEKALELLISERWQGRVIDDLNEAITAVKNARATFHKEPDPCHSTPPHR